MSDEPNAAMRLLWGPPPKPTRGPKPALSLTGIAEAGIEIADSQGLAALSMQRLAGALGYTKMSLYRYVPGKAELIALMVEQAMGEPPASREADWRGQLGDWARRLYAVFAHHPWLLDATVGPRPIGPAEVSWMERGVSALAHTRLTGAEQLDALALLAGHARGIAVQARASAQPESQLTAVLGELMTTQRDRFPAVATAMASVAESGGQNQALEFGLDRILAGLDALIAERADPC
ncbi:MULTISPECIES: TetR/AcrR family transcriptional regulator [Kitasatospora]|uniref:TetR/AcrR family transcriptional regulator n=1 Tax=Kitasatospora TaxID=2063 RepID=UPI000CBDECED|nr:TetR/AcrR family transcriptional regulator C-terminal domain-containing protein [Kitasatospora sp. GP30]MDH6139676.1 AcrR family transcriptional regulator [Kitasatospora sp. GP30]